MMKKLIDEDSFLVPKGNVMDRIKLFDKTLKTVKDFRALFPNVKIPEKDEMTINIGKLYKGELRYIVVGKRVFLSDLR